MKKKYKLKYISDFDNPDGQNEASIYTIHEVDMSSDNDEFSIFLSKYAKKYRKQVKWATLRLKRMVKLRGIQMDQFVNESADGSEPVYKLTETGRLRLYFVISDNLTIIFGGGGEKFVRTWQQDPILRNVLYGLCDLIKQIDKLGDRITKSNCQDYHFEIDLEV